jgi:para-aminobenzoate synthetase component 1
MPTSGDKTAVAARVRWEALPARATPAAVLDLLAAQPLPVMLDSAADDPRYGRYSVIACRPAEVLTVRDGRVWNRAGEELPGRSVLAALRATLGSAQATGALPGPYGPGWIGFVGYEFGRHIERLPGRAIRDTALPDLHLALYEAVAVYDGMDGRWVLSWLEKPSARGAREALKGIVLASPVGGAEGEGSSPAARPLPRAESNFTADAYRSAVQRCIDYIAAGDIFQVNLSQRLTLPTTASPVALYRALRRRNPAWYSALLLLDGPAVLSSSPELFLRVRGQEVLTRPIKGTRPRTGDPSEDAAASAELVASPKDNAELAMIIDLLRNDLGRVCRYGSIQVVNRCELETHPTVYHLVGSVTGRLCDEVDWVDLLRATFPGGSITGAPKIRAMEIIDELEGVARGVYTGCIGYLGLTGNAELNIAIRTVVCDGGRAHVHAGGGIVADSTPQGEYQETLDKARALLEAIGSAQGRASR